MSVGFRAVQWNRDKLVYDGILLCAVAERLSASIFTVDSAFEAYSRHLPLELFVPRADA